MPKNRGKDFELVIRNAFKLVENTSIIRLPDPVMGYAGQRNICDFIVYRYPNQYFIECKSTQGNTLPFSNITVNQWQGLLKMSKCKGVVAGIIVWYVQKDVTLFIPIQSLQKAKENGAKSIHYLCLEKRNSFGFEGIYIHGKKRRVFFDYDMKGFFNDIRQFTSGKS